MCGKNKFPRGGRGEISGNLDGATEFRLARVSIRSTSTTSERMSHREVVAEDPSPIPSRSSRLVRRLSPRSFRQSKNRARQWDEIATICAHYDVYERCKRNPGERSARPGERKVPRPLSGSLFYLAPCYIQRNVFYCVLSRDKLSFTR